MYICNMYFREKILRMMKETWKWKKMEEEEKIVIVVVILSQNQSV